MRELRTGAALVARRDSVAGAGLHSWIDTPLVGYADRVLPVDTEVAESCADLHVPDPRPAEDAWIAATARVHKLTVVTRNANDFAPMGVSVLNPWDAER